MTLMQIAFDLDNALAAVADAKDPEQIAAAEAGLMQHIQAQTDKVSAIGLVLNRMEREAAGLYAEAELIAAAARVETEQKRLRMYVQRAMELSGTSQLKSPLATFSIADGAESVEIVNADMIPYTYRRELGPPPPDKRAIKDALKAGKSVPGARLTKGEASLRVRYAKSSAEVVAEVAS